MNNHTGKENKEIRMTKSCLNWAKTFSKILDRIGQDRIAEIKECDT